MKNFITRSLTGIVYAGTVVFCVLFNSYTFLALFTIVSFLCLWEFYRMINLLKDTGINLYIHGIGGTLMFLSVFLFTSGYTCKFIFSFYLLYIAGVLIYGLYSNQNKSLSHLAYIFFGQCYIALPFSVLNFLVFSCSSQTPQVYQSVFLFSLFLFIWANDTGAYLIGVKFGKHRLWERHSPKKSWEGFFGGLVFSIITAFVFARFNPQIAWYHWVSMSVGVAVFSVYGDLVESMIKRSVGVKDSGHLLPGHGGFLDRFDSLLLAVYFMVFYLGVFIQN